MIKKLLTYTLAISTMVWSVGLLATPLTVGAAVSGDLIKMSGNTAVYYLGADNKRYVFPNEKTYKTWYPNFSGVMTISATELASYAIGGNVTYRPGVKMVKITTDPKVYAVDANGTLRHITTEAIAVALYGAAWATMVEDVSDAFFVNYSIGAAITAASQFSPANATATATSINVDKNLGAVVNVGSSLTISLASDTPATGIVLGNSAQVPFTKINLTASADGDAIIDSWVVERMGLASDASFSSIDILDGATMLAINQTGKSLSSLHTATFTEDFTIKAGTTRSVYIAGNMVTSLAATAGEIPVLALKSIVLKGGATIVGTLPILGNYQQLNGTITIGTATVARGAYENATNSTLKVGTMGYTLFSFSILAGSAEDLSFTRVKVYQSGSASLTTDIANTALYQDGTKLATGVIEGNYMIFTFPTVAILKGQTKQFLVKADIVGGSGRTIETGIYQDRDLLVQGQTYGANIIPTYTTVGSTGKLSSPIHTVSVGTLNVGTSNTIPAGNITIGSDQVIGAFELEAKGEPVNITALTLTIVSNASGTIEDALASVKLVNSAGIVVAGPTDVTNNTLTVAFTDTFTVPVGVNAYKVVATLATNGGWANNNTISARLATGASAITAKGDTTGLTITATPASNVNTNTQTIKTATLAVSKNSLPANKSVLANSTSVLIGSWSFDASNSGEDIRITSIAIKASTTGKLNALTLKDGTTTLDPINDAPTAGAEATSTFALTSPIVITKGTSKTLDLYANIASTATAGEVDAYGITSDAAITAYGVSTGNAATVTTTAHDGALITIAGSATLTVDAHPDQDPSSLIVSGTTGQEIAEVRLKAANANVDITKLTVHLVDGALTGTNVGTFNSVSKFFLRLNGVVIGNTSGYNMNAASVEVNLQRGVLTVPTSAGSTGVKLSVMADIFADPTTGNPFTSNADIKVGLRGANGFTALDAANNTVTPTYNDSTGSAVIIHKAVPQVVNETPANKLGASSVLHRTKITAVGNAIGLYKLSYQSSTSSSVTITNAYTKLAACSSGCSGIAAGSQLSATVADATYLADGLVTWSLPISQTQSHGKYFVSIAAGSVATIDLFATVGTTANVDSVSTALLGDTASAASDDLAGQPAAEWVTNEQGNFVWSDLINADTQAAATLTNKQWFNGYYVNGLGATTTSTPVVVAE